MLVLKVIGQEGREDRKHEVIFHYGITLLPKQVMINEQSKLKRLNAGCDAVVNQSCGLNSKTPAPRLYPEPPDSLSLYCATIILPPSH